MQFDEIVKQKKRFNGKPFSHWQAMADELVVEQIIRAALQHCGENSLPGHLARQRLLEIARRENETIYHRVLKMRNRCLEGFALVMSSLSVR